MSKKNNQVISIDKFNKIEELYYNRANDFYINLDKGTMLDVYSIITKKHKRKKKISLRFLDWFVTKYCKLYSISINVNNQYNKEDKYNINNRYKAQLKSFHKIYLDPFKRTKESFKFIYKCQGYEFITSLCQLNFMKWIIEYDILKYVINNYETLIEKVEYVNNLHKKNKNDEKSSLYSFNSSSSLTVDLDNNKLSKKDNKKRLILEI